MTALVRLRLPGIPSRVLVQGLAQAVPCGVRRATAAGGGQIKFFPAGSVELPSKGLLAPGDGHVLYSRS